MPRSSRGMSFIGAVIIAVAFLIAILIAVSWIISAQQTQFKRPNMIVEKVETFSAGNGIWLEIKNYGIETTRLEKIYIYDPEYGKYYIAYANATSNNVIDPETRAVVGDMEAKPLSASEGGIVYVKILFDAGVLKGNLITGIAVFDKTLAPWKVYRTTPPISKPGYAVNAWRIKLFIFNPSDTTIFTDNRTLFLPGTVTKLPIAVILINRYTSFAGHFFNWTCGLAQAYGWTPGADVRFTDAYRNVELPFYRYYFNCTTYTAVFIVYLKNVTIFPRQTYPIYMWYAPWIAGGGTLTVADKSNTTVYYLAINNSVEDLFKSRPAWYYNNGLRSKIRWVRDTTADDEMSPIYDYQGDREDLNLTYYGDWVWDGSDHIVCSVDYRNDDYRCTIIYLNLTDGFFERFQVGDWYYYQYPEGYSWIMEVAFNQTHYAAQEPFNQTYIFGLSPMLFYRYGWWFGVWWSGAWYGWIAKTFAATAANWAIIVSERRLSQVVPPNIYVYNIENVEKVVVVNTTIIQWWFRYYAVNPVPTTLSITPGGTVRVVVYNDTNLNRIILNITDLASGRSWVYRIVPGSDSSFMVVYVNSTGGYVKTFINAFGATVYYRDTYYPSVTNYGYRGFPAYTVRTYFLWPRYFGVWWVASWYNDVDENRIILVGNEIESSLRNKNLSVLNFSKLHRLVYSYTSGADLIGTQFVWMGIASEGNSIDDDFGTPPPLQFITAEASGAYGDELIEGNTVGFSADDLATRDVTGIYDPEVQIDWMRVIIGLGYIWWEGPTLDQWPFG